MNSTFKAVTKDIEIAAGWQQKYRQIMLLGKQLPAMPDALKVDDALVKGCESKVWLYIEFDHSENSLVLAGDSDTRIVKGLLALILALYNGLTPEAQAGKPTLVKSVLVTLQRQLMIHCLQKYVIFCENSTTLVAIQSENLTSIVFILQSSLYIQPLKVRFAKQNKVQMVQ